VSPCRMASRHAGWPVAMQDGQSPCRIDPDQELADFTRKGGTTG
jgi:hypothetical protein